jgi:hypothetical protein
LNAAEPSLEDSLAAQVRHLSGYVMSEPEAADAAAVSKDPELRKGKTVKQALDVWLRLHANEFGLTKEDGNPNEQGIQEVAKIANWDTKGGAPKTPGAG